MFISEIIVIGFFFAFVVSPCDSVTCQNEGTCSVEAGLAVCCCKGAYSGTTCEGENCIVISI